MKITEKMFRESAARTKLADLLHEHPEIIDLLEAKPDGIPVINGQHYPDSVMSRILAECVGNNRAVNKLVRLSEPWQDKAAVGFDQSPDRPEFYDYLPEQLKQYVREQYTQNTQP